MNGSVLGRGLGSLIPSKNAKKSINGKSISRDDNDYIENVEIEKIKPNPQQPRRDFDRDSLEDLIDSIKVHGIIQPLVVIKGADGIQLITGERRLRAAKLLGLKRVPVVVRSATDQEKLELALVENVQRQDLNPIEKAYGYQRLIDEFGLKQEEVAKKVGQSRAAVANSLRLLNLPAEMQKALQTGKLSEGHAKVLLGVSSEEEQVRLFKEILRSKLSVRIAESQARRVSVKKHTRRITRDPNIEEKEEVLQQSLGTRVKISRHGQQGTITIHFYSAEELQEIIRKISK